jgi:uncharacterized protein
VKDVPGESALAAARLLAQGHTVPFLARYRKDETGGLDEVALRRVVAAREVFERLEARRASILEAAERHKKRSPALEERVAAAVDLATLEDLSLPFRKRKGPTALAREAGLEPLADWIWNTGHGTETPQEGQTLELWAFTFRNPEKGVPEAADAIAGARGLLVERLAEDPDLRALVRREVFAHGLIEAVKTERAKPGSKHEAVFGVREKASVLRESEQVHRIFALRRAANEGELKLRVAPPEGDAAGWKALEEAFAAAALSVEDAPGAAVLLSAAHEALEAHVHPDMGAELLQSVREDADRAAIRPLAEGLRRRLMAPALGARAVLGLHPTKDGGVVALADAQGRFVKGGRFLLAEEKLAEARELLAGLAREGGVAAVAVGDGTAGRERAQLVEDALAAAGLSQVVVQVVSEAAAAAWRSSDPAKAELPEAEPEARGALALARRLQDPLMELCRSEPRALADGAYLHEVSQRLLGKRLEQTLDSCLHDVGLDLNRASAAPLARLAGLSEEAALALVARRDAQGPFASRAALRESGLLDEKSFQESAAFLSVRPSPEPLDGTRVHPERYAALAACAARLGKPLAELLGEGAKALRDDPELRAALGPRAYEDVLAELAAPGRDPRGPFVPFRFRADVRRLEDLRPGLVCAGLVTNSTSFGVFVDIGVPHDGLVHVSQLPAREGDQAQALLLPGDRVEVRVVKVDLAKKQISLSMRGVAPRGAERPRTQRPRSEGKAAGGPRRPRPDSAARPGASRSAAPRRGVPQTGADRGTQAAAPTPEGAASSPKPATPRRDAPSGPRRGSKPDRPAGRSDRPPSRPDRPDRSGPRSEPARPGPRPAFNNPFAVLAALKEPKKG